MIDKLIAASSVGAALADVKARGIDAHLADVEPPPPKKKRKKSTPLTHRALAELRKRGWTAQVVERRLPRTFTTVDLFGVIDVVAIAPPDAQCDYPRIMGIQVTDGTSHANRRTKILAEPRALEWVKAGGRLELWSYSKRGAANKRKLWALRIETYEEMLGTPARSNSVDPLISKIAALCNNGANLSAADTITKISNVLGVPF